MCTVVLVDVNQGRLDLAARAEPDVAIDSTKSDSIFTFRVVVTAVPFAAESELELPHATKSTAPRTRIEVARIRDMRRGLYRSPRLPQPRRKVVMTAGCEESRGS